MAARDKTTGHAVSAMLMLCLFLMIPITVSAQSITVDDSAPPASTDRINELSDLITEKTEQRNNLTQAIKASGSNADASDREKLQELNADLKTLSNSFLYTVLGSTANIQSFDDEPVVDTTWQQDIIEVMEPLLGTLKAVTRRPREIADLRVKVSDAKGKAAAVQSAIDTADKIAVDSLSSSAVATLQDYEDGWQQDLRQAKQDQLVAEAQLESLLATDSAGWSDVWKNAKSFVLGRGLTLLLAIFAGITAWFLVRCIWWLYSTKFASKEVRRKSTFYRVASYSSYVISGLMVLIAVLFVLWLREDLLLLALAFLALASIAMGFRHYVPNYLNEARLLLNLGLVKEGERIVYEGLPWQVVSLNVQSVLRNPAIDGILRVPLKALSGLISRPVKNNLWFPTNKGDYVILPNGMFGQVKRQTPDLVEFLVRGGSTVTFPSAEFYSLQVENISGSDVFGVSTTFGLDYNLQSISLTTVPETLKAGVHKALVDAGYEKHIKGELIELCAANASSLDYLIFITLSSEVASSYNAIVRLLVQTCIDISNKNNWNIPFPQLSVHTTSLT